MLTLRGLEIHPHSSLPYGEGYVMGHAVYVDQQGYNRIQRGDDPAVALADYQFHFLPAMGSGITWSIGDAHSVTEIRPAEPSAP